MMRTEKWPPIDPGTQVRTLEAKTPDSEWCQPAGRKWGITGTVITHHDSHGLCYEVRHPDGTIGSYDPSELEVVN